MVFLFSCSGLFFCLPHYRGPAHMKTDQIKHDEPEEGTGNAGHLLDLCFLPLLRSLGMCHASEKPQDSPGSVGEFRDCTLRPTLIAPILPIKNLRLRDGRNLLKATPLVDGKIGTRTQDSLFLVWQLVQCYFYKRRQM